MSEEATNPVDVEELVPGTEGVADEANAQGDDQPQLDENGDPIEGEPEDDSEEIDYEGQKLRIPKVLKDGILRQADYTRKTQELAEERRALAARHTEAAQQAEAIKATLEERVTLKRLESTLQEYSTLNWQDYAAQNGAEATAAAMAQWQQLREAHTGLNAEITEKEQGFRQQSERATATALLEAEQILQRDIPDFGPEVLKAVVTTAQQFGFTADELKDSFVGADGKADVRAFKLFHRLQAAESKLAGIEAKTKPAVIPKTGSTVQPAKTVGQKSTGYKPGLNDELPIDEWNRRRQASLAKR